MTGALKTELAKRISAGEVLVLVGTGVSMAVTGNNPLASWKGFIENGIKRCADRGLHDTAWPKWQEIMLTMLNEGDLKDLLSVAEQVSDRLGWKPTEPCNSDWNEWLRTTIGELRPSHPELIEAIDDLRIPIATLNYDNLLTDVTGRDRLTWQEPEQWLPVLKGGDKAILHLHGHWRKPSSVILGVRGYSTLVRKELAQHLQKVVATTLSLLFIGCGGTLKDPNFETLLTWMRQYGKLFTHRHYLLLPRGEQPAVAAGLLSEAGVECVFYDDDLLSVIRDLAGSPYGQATPALTAIESFVRKVTDDGLLPFLTDVGLAELAVDWLSNEAGVPKFFARLIIRALAMLSGRPEDSTARSLLDISRHLPFYSNVEVTLAALLHYIGAELTPREETKQILSRRRSLKVNAEAASTIPLDARAMLDNCCTTQALTTALQATMSGDAVKALSSRLSTCIKQNIGTLASQPPLLLMVFEEDQTGLDRFLYGTQTSSFLGREGEISELEVFLAAPSRFCWWMVTGEGGLGKSRLALELCLRNGNVWRAGFLPTDFSLDDYRDWSPNQATLIIVDYAAYRAGDIGDLMRIIRTRANNSAFQWPVRVLLLERHARRYFRGEIEDIDIMDAAWFRRLLGVGNQRRAALDSWYAKRAPMILGALHEDATWTIICTFAFGNEQWPIEKREQLLGSLEAIDPRLHRPLYAALLGDAISAGSNYSRFRKLDALIDILEREERWFWVPQWELDGVVSQEDRDNDKDVLALATMAGGIDIRSVSVSSVIAMIKRPRFSATRYGGMAAGSTDSFLKPLTPDIIGEAFVLEWLKPDNPLQTERLERIKANALSLSDDNTASFLYRAEMDFPGHPTLAWLL